MKNILLLEDDPFIANIYSELVEAKGHKLELITQAAELLQKAQTDSPNLIILDILMSHQNGLHVLEKLKLDPKTAHVPVVILTNLSDDAMKEKALKLGAKAWLIKSENEPTTMITKILAFAR